MEIEKKAILGLHVFKVSDARLKRSDGSNRNDRKIEKLNTGNLLAFFKHALQQRIEFHYGRKLLMTSIFQKLGSSSLRIKSKKPWRCCSQLEINEGMANSWLRIDGCIQAGSLGKMDFNQNPKSIPDLSAFSKFTRRRKHRNVFIENTS